MHLLEKDFCSVAKDVSKDFCNVEKSAVVTRARMHVAGEAVSVMGITACSGPTQETEEDDAVFAARQAQFDAARATCKALVEAARAEAALAARSTALDRLTTPPSAVLSSAAATARLGWQQRR